MKLIGKQICLKLDVSTFQFSEKNSTLKQIK